MITMESQIKGIKLNAQGRIPNKFIVREEPKEEQNLTFSNCFIQ